MEDQPIMTVAAPLPVPARWLALVAVLAGLAFLPLAAVLEGPAVVAAKGAGVTLLALAALALRAPGGGWLAAIMAAGALGDVLLEIPGLFIAGAGSFAAGHIIAMIFYARRRRPSGAPLRLGAAALILFGLIMPPLLQPRLLPVGVAMLYAVLLCGMAASLWLSRLPRIAAWGALLFVASDTLIVARLAGHSLGGPTLSGAAVWLSYLAGQAMIWLGVARGLISDQSAAGASGPGAG